jgi:hypothetical protein
MTLKLIRNSRTTQRDAGFCSDRTVRAAPCPLITVLLLVICEALGAGHANVAGKWNVTVRMPGGPVSEEWTIHQKGTAVTGTAKGQRGGELPISGTIEGTFFRVSVKDGQKEYKVRATVDGDAMDGSITLGVGDARLWFAKRPTVTKK